jgi:isopentenyl-diphosphate delta-isomerase
MSNENNLELRKRHHLELAEQSQIKVQQKNQCVNYEPLFYPHPTSQDWLSEFEFMGKKMLAPLWISSMTGGTGPAREINQNLGRVCGEFGLGMGLGSIRPLLYSNEFFNDFNLRPLIGKSHPFFANVGIVQVEELLLNNDTNRLHDLVEKLDVDGLIIHLNILQEWFQPEGERLKRPAYENIKEFLDRATYKIIVKEVGQGLGPHSLKALMQLPLSAIEFGAFGGTNFSHLEMLRAKDNKYTSREAFSFVGHHAEEMVESINHIISTTSQSNILCKNFIISGGIRSMLQGYTLMQQCVGASVIGQAKPYLEFASQSYDQLKAFVENQLEALSMAKRFLTIK